MTAANIIIPFILGSYLIGFVIAVWYVIKRIKIKMRLSKRTAKANRKSAEQGNASAQVLLGNAYHNGYGIKKDDNEALQWWRKAAEHNNAHAYHNLGVAYFNGWGVSIDKVEAFKWFLKAAEKGDANSQFFVGQAYNSGDGIEKDEAQGFEWFKKATEQNHAVALNNVGIAYHTGKGIEKNDTEAIKWWQKSCECGNSIACSNVGTAYKRGWSVLVDKDEAIKWYRKAAKLGHAGAQFSIGSTYRDASILTVKPNEFRAFNWRKKILYIKNAVIAMHWLEKAAKQGHGLSQNAMGRIFNRSKNHKDAIAWWRKAAEQGNELAQFNLGMAYEKGLGVEQSYIEAYKWFDIIQEDVRAIEKHETLEKQMTGEQITQAKELSQQWQQEHSKNITNPQLEN